MAHSGDGTGWDTGDPDDTEPRKDGAKEIRDLRTGVGIRVDKEHETLAAASAGGEHKEGSAKAYTSLAANRPDGSTPLDADDENRIAVVAGIPYYWDGTEWLPVNAPVKIGTYAVSSSYGSFVDVVYPFQTILFSHTAGINFFVNCSLATDEDLVGVGVDADGDENVFTVNCDQDGNFRFRVKSSDFSGTLRYRVLP